MLKKAIDDGFCITICYTQNKSPQASHSASTIVMLCSSLKNDFPVEHLFLHGSEGLIVLERSLLTEAYSGNCDVYVFIKFICCHFTVEMTLGSLQKDEKMT